MQVNLPIRITRLSYLALVAITFAPVAQAAPIQPLPVKIDRSASRQIDFFNATSNQNQMFLGDGSSIHSMSTLYRSARTDARFLSGTHTLSPFLRSGSVNLSNVTDTPTPIAGAAIPASPRHSILGLAILARRRLRTTH